MIRLVLRWAWRVGVLLLGAIVIYLVVTAVQVWLTSRQYDPRPASAAIVMGAAQYDGTPSPDLKARLDEALDLWHAGDVHLIVVTGTKKPGDAYTEAQASARYLEAEGVPSDAIVKVGGDDSWGNIAGAAKVLTARGDRSVLMVTDPFHEDRSMAIATNVGLTPYPTPTRNSPIRGLSTIPYFAKETVGVGIGRIFGYQNLGPFHGFVDGHD